MKIYLDNDGLPPLLQGVIQVFKNKEFQKIILVLFILGMLFLTFYIEKPNKKNIIPNIKTKLVCDLKKSPLEALRLEEQKFPMGTILPQPVSEPLSEQRPDITIETYTGEASHYCQMPGLETCANGEPLIDSALTCALPPSIGKDPNTGQYRFGMRVRVTNLENGLSVVCRYNDSGPFVGGRIIDLTTASQQAIGMDGLAPVKIELLHTEIATTSASFSYGYCTDYVASKVPVVWNGNAKEWNYQAILTGYKTGTIPSVGAILCTNESWYGHVAYVESYNSDGTIKISEKNYNGWNQLSYRNVPSNFGTYIY